MAKRRSNNERDREERERRIIRIAEFRERYGSTLNFRIIDTIGVPHPYCITPRHVTWASDHWAGILNKESIIDSEKHGGARCDICEGQLSFEKHEQALLVECDMDIHDNTVPPDNQGKIQMNEELHEWLKEIKERVGKDGYAGFAFIKGSK